MAIGDPRLLGTAVADAAGHASLSRPVPAEFSGEAGRFQAVEHSGCRVSNLVAHTFE